MRIWDVSPSILCRKHLLGEHRELHALWVVISQHKKGYAKHPETLRWLGKLQAMNKRHDELVKEMERRGYQHHSPLDQSLATGKAIQTSFVHTIEEQIQILKDKGCECKV